MSQVIELQGELQETQALLAQLEQAAARNPASVGLRINGQSVAKRFRELEQEFRRLTAESAIDVCRYRLFSGGQESFMPAIAVANSIREFQTLFSTAYDAIKNGPRKKPSITEVARETTLGFGYSFAGSVGIVMTLENRQLSLFESGLDQAMSGVFSLAKARTPMDVVAASATLGGPTIRALKNWVDDHVEDNLGIGVQWCHGNTVKGELTLQVPEMKELATVLNAASRPISDMIKLQGTIEGTEHLSSRRIHFLADDGTEIKCPYRPGVISKENPIKSPARYEATFQKKAKKIIATDQDVEASYVLTNLKEIS